MSRSRKKKAIVKDHTGRWYNKAIRHRQNQAVRDIRTLIDMLDYLIPHPNEIVNKYDISDWKFVCENYHDKEYENKIKRK